MATMRSNPRLQVGSASWISEERASAAQIAEAETEEFTFSARNEIEWLNEHMAEIFSKNQVNVAEIFKTPGKLRGKTPRTIRKNNHLERRAPLSDVFSSTPRGALSPFRQTHFEKPVATFQVAEDGPGPPSEPETETGQDASEARAILSQKPPTNFLDSGYHGSQMFDATQPTQLNDAIEGALSPRGPTPPPKDDIIVEDSPQQNAMDVIDEADERRTTEGSFQSAREEQTRNMAVEPVPEPQITKAHVHLEEARRPILESPLLNRTHPPTSPQKHSPERPAADSPPQPAHNVDEGALEAEDEHMEDVQSPSEGSSPIRPIVRKSSLNFASLPAREPITTKKSLGNPSRKSQLDQTRTSYYGRQTGGKSIGSSRHEYGQDEHDGMDLDDVDHEESNKDDENSTISRLHNKTSTQRLQDQISMLGKSQSNVRPSKSIASGAVASQAAQPMHGISSQDTCQSKSPTRSPQRSPLRQDRPFVAPGAFPEDEEDSWIGPPTAAPEVQPSVFSPRPPMTKYHSADVMEGVHDKESIGGTQFSIPKRGEESKHRSPTRQQPSIPERTTSTLGHTKSVSTSILRSPRKAGDSPGHKKAISVSNPTPSINTEEVGSTTPPKSPSRSRSSPLKAAKDKFSSILKTSRGLFASSAAVSAEAKSSALSPSSTRVAVAMSTTRSFEDSIQSQPSYTSLDTQMTSDQHSQHAPRSPGKASVRKTRASTEREERRKEEESKESKESRRMDEQLRKARAKVDADARVHHHLEQERIAAMQREITARKEQDRLAKASQADIPRATRSSPRKTKAQLEAEGIAAAAASVDELSKDTEMIDHSAMPPPAVPRPKSQIGRPIAKRPLKPEKALTIKAKPPTVIRVDTGSQRGHQYHPSNSTLAATLQESLTGPSQPISSQGTLRSKASTSSIQSKSSTSSFKSAASKALEAAARKKEQDELAAQRKKEAKLDIERQREAIKEEQRRRDEQQRRQEVIRQREVQREREQAASQADAKRNASRQAIEKRRLEVEKAKQSGAPPPAVRPQPSGDVQSSINSDKALPAVPLRGDQPQSSRPAHRPQEDLGRSVNSVLQNAAKAPPKRPLQQDADEHNGRPGMPRNPPSYQHNDAHTKRRKTSENFDNDDEDMTERHNNIKAPPIRQSSSRPKEMPTKSLFPSGYATAPQPSNLQRSTLISQHNMNQSKPAHPMDMAQVSKAPIPFAASSSQPNAQSHKTPARPGAHANASKSTGKSAAKSSPRYQNGENIELPEINTDSEDNDSDADDGGFVPMAWTDSPILRSTLAKQELIDPSDVFGHPGPLNMEEVFPKNKERLHKFRARTSSANWSGQDRLTEDEIKKDLQARERVRRQGGWTYDSMV